jgi:hypothetical protein
MSEMVERVAIAIAGGLNAWAEMWEESLREEYRIDARAAIEAMREPTDAMLERGSVGLYDCAAHDGHGGVETSPPLPVWQNMIDAALK